MRIVVDESSIRIRLSRWQKILGLLRDISIPRDELADVTVLENAMPDVMSTGLKVGLRLPWLYYVARTIRLDEAFIVRRGVPALALALDGHGPLRRVLVSTPDARLLADELAHPRTVAPAAG